MSEKASHRYLNISEYVLDKHGYGKLCKAGNWCKESFSELNGLLMWSPFFY